ncbi:MAG: PqqD family protein [Acetatifactor sp.]|nr:PqqD family protein [Acetatifactor sp.]
MRYQLRYAAGQYWLLDTWQEGVPYKRPLTMNEVGADIWRMMEQGCSQKHIVDVLGREYQVSSEVVEKDLEQFLAQLAEFGIEETEENKLSLNSGKEGI